MTDLDNKLREIATRMLGGYPKTASEEVDLAMAEIKEACRDSIQEMLDDPSFREGLHKAIKDSGWAKVRGWGVEQGELKDLMTGQEWYERFLEELQEEIVIISSDHPAIKAAKKASGLND